MSDYLSLAVAATELPGNPHVSTLQRWRLYGVQAGGRRIKLRTVRVGGRRLVERRALEEFLLEVTAAADGEESTPRTTEYKEDANEAGQYRLEADGE